MEEHIQNMEKLIAAILSEEPKVRLDSTLLVLAYAIRDLSMHVKELEKHEA